MVRGDLRLITPQHWRTGLETGFVGAAVLLVLYNTSFRVIFDGWFRQIVSTALIVTMVDRLVHPSHFGGEFGEGIATGISAALLSIMIGMIRNAIKW